MLCALALGIMFLGIVPFATFVAPAAASLCVMFFVIEFSKKMAFAIYFIISVLSLLLVPEKEVVFLFICVFGYYPILKAVFEKHFNRLPGMMLKLLCFNVAVVSMYLLLINVFVVAAIKDEFAAYTTGLLIALLVLGNIVFLVYDYALTRLVSGYVNGLRQKIIKGD